ncbi:MAG: OmpA family protein [Fibrobacter sp.]|nr:OmpA family protein [Fibrobacter sp.]
MKKLTLLIALAQSLVFAQTGLLGGRTGLHQQDTETLGFFHFRVGTGGTIATDNWGYTRAAQFTDQYGKTQYFDVWDARMEKGRIDGALAGNFNFAMGIMDNLDIGISLPIYYDHAKDYSGEAIRAHMGKGGLGDLQFYGKFRTPHWFGPDYMTTAAVVDLTIPTGWRGVGIRPRHAWFLDNEGGPTYAYTANSVMLGLTGIVSVDYTKKGVPLVWNSSLGLMLGFGDASNTLVYSTGVNWQVNDYIQPFLEFSGEMRFGNDAYPISPITDPMVLTPGINVKIPFLNIDFAAGIDIGIGNLVDGYSTKEALEGCKDFQIKYKGETGYRASYCYVAQPLIAGIAKLTWTFGFDGDDDNDGVKNRKDKCPETFPPIVVDEDGCGIDTDEDKVFDGIDKCPDTPKGVPVDSVGCPFDTDEDGVVDYKDMCPDTPKGVPVDSVGCPFDTDEDGVLDYKDQCPNTPKGIKVDSVGCPLDTDKDGVFDGPDKCPDTPEGVAVDADGCPLDTDKDGVPDYRDKCPNTLPGIKVNKRGCPLRRKEDLDYLKKGIQFEFDSAKLLKSSYPTLDDIIALLEKIPEVKLEVQGHTDIVGTEDYNQKLSEDRAHSVTDYFESKGIAGERLRAIGFGTRVPVADNVTDEGRAKNRRVELIPFGYYTEGDSTVAAPSDSLLNDSTAVPPPTKSEVKSNANPEVKVKLKVDPTKKVRSASKAGSKRKKEIEAKAAKAVEELKAEVKTKVEEIKAKVAPAAEKPAETPAEKPAAAEPAKASAPAPTAAETAPTP